MKTAIIGCGTIARTHIDSLLRLGHEVVGLCDSDRTRAENLSREFSLGADIYSDYMGLIAASDLQSVHICTPHFEHAEMSIAALNKGLNVLCEKPVCISASQYRALREAEDASSACFGVCFQNRYLATSKKLKQLAERGAEGAFAAVPWSRDEQYYLATDWRGRKSREGGGVLMNQAIHTLDLLLWIFGDPVYVTGTVSNDHLRGVIDEEDTAAVYLEFASGATATLYATTANAFNSPVTVSLKAADGSFTAMCNRVYNNTTGESVAINADNGVVAKDYWGYGHLTLIKHFYDCAEKHKPFPIGAREAYKAVKVILEIYASQGEKRKIDFKELV